MIYIFIYIDLAVWIKAQRRIRRNKQLLKGRYDLLQAIQFNWGSTTMTGTTRPTTRRTKVVIHDDDEKSTHEGLCLDCACKIMENGGTCPLCRCRIFGVASSQSRRVIEEATRAATAPALGAHTVGPGLYPDLTDALLGRRRQ